MELAIGTLLQGGKYKIKKMLGQGGFGITYLAENTMLDGKVAIKEFFFKQYCDRDEATSHVIISTAGNREIVERFKVKFVKEARTIFKLNHPNIVCIHDIFEENGTAYYVMDYIEGESLGDMVKRRGAIPESEAIGYIKEVASTLSYIHGKNINHLDIKPNNIMRRKGDGQIFVIDFGVAKQYDAETSKGTTTTPVGISHGYSPSEQYQKDGVQSFSPQSDVYALAATLYKLLTGITPPEAMIVQDKGLPTDELKSKGISSSVINAIEAAMRSRSVRTQSIEAFIASLASTSNLETDESTTLTLEMQRAEEVRKRKEEEEKARKAPQESGSKSTWLWAILGAIVVIGIIIGVNSKGESSDDSNATQAETNAQYQQVSSQTFTANGVSFDMMKVEAGTFTMGATSEMKDPEDDEMPAHQVTLTNGYYIGKTEVTQALWKAVMGNNPSEFKGDNLPVECVSWNDCKEFISKLNSMTGENFRLPTEAEWEFAARGGNNSNHYQYSGSNNIDDVAWYVCNSGDKTHAVATKQPNEIGIYDMSGNVLEWCADYWGNYSSSSQTNPTGPSSGSCRVGRGGSWYDVARICRSSFRDGDDPDNLRIVLGFRLALSQ